MSDVYEILAICLEEIEKGADIDSVLFRYPTYASELRPLLEAAVKAIKVDVPDPSEAVIRRNRARILQHAAQLRESKVRITTRRLWSVPLRRALVTLVVVGVLFISGTGLVRAASMTLPGDNLYPVKRTWEDVHVLFTFDLQAREALEVEHENERLQELKQLFMSGRSVQVDFSGLVTRQSENLWLVSGVAVAISAQTEIPVQPIVEGNAIRVVGITQSDGAVLAQRIELLPAGVPLPEVEDDESFEPTNEDSESETPDVTETPASTFEPTYQSLHGSIQSINGNIWVVNGQIMNVSAARIRERPHVGDNIRVKGYFDANGLFIVTKIEASESNSSSGGDSVSEDNNDPDGVEDNHNNEDDHEDDHQEDNPDDDSRDGSHE